MTPSLAVEPVGAGKIEPERLCSWLGYGVWLIDPFKEWILPHFLRSEYEPLQKILDRGKEENQPAGERVRVPFGQGTIGYVVANAETFADGLYLVDDCEADLRGEVVVADRYLGQVNVLLIPVWSSPEDKRYVQAVFSLYLPLPGFLEREAFAKSFARAVEPLGEALASFAETGRYRALIRAVRDGGRAERRQAGADGAIDLGGSVRANVAAPIAGQGVIGFPWVGVLDCGPGGLLDASSPGGRSPLTTWVEPDSLMRWRQIRTIDRCIRAYPYPEGDSKPPPQFDRDPTKFDFHDPCEWSENVRDLVLPLTADLEGHRSICGLVRIHLSGASVPKRCAAWRQAVESLEPGLHRVGQALIHLRQFLSRTPEEMKVVREWEGFLFREFFEVLFGATPETVRGRLDEMSKRAVDVLPEGFEEGTEQGVLDAKRLAKLLFSLYGPLRETKFDESGILGASYWSCDEEMVLAEEPEDLGDPHFLRDLQRTLTLVVTTGNRRGKELNASWLDNGLSGRFDLEGGTSGTTCYLHLALPSKSSISKQPRFDKMRVDPPSPSSPGAPYHVVFFRSGGGETISSKWLLRPTVPMVRAWYVRKDLNGASQPLSPEAATKGGPLTQHLAWVQQERTRRLPEVLEGLREIWDPRDGVVGKVQLFQIDWRKAPRNEAAWRDENDPPSEAGERTALRTLLWHLGRDELQDVHQVWAVPVVVLDHVYYWVLVGVRHQLTEGEEDLFDIVLSQIEAGIGLLAADADQKTLRKVFLNDFQRRDYRHALRAPLENAVQALEKMARGDLRVDLAEEALYEVNRARDWFYLRMSKIEDSFDAVRGNTLGQVLFGAASFALRRDDQKTTDRRAYYDGVVRTLGTRELKQALRLPSQEHYALLLLLWTDLLFNAACHSEHDSEVRIEWQPENGVLTLRNPIRPGDDRESFTEKCGVLNACLGLDAPDLPWRGPGHIGLPNVHSAATRLRVALRYHIVADVGRDWCLVSVYLKRFLPTGEEDARG
jgi:hypothetical protein